MTTCNANPSALFIQDGCTRGKLKTAAMMTAPINECTQGRRALRPGMLVALRNMITKTGSNTHGRTASARQVAVSPNGEAHSPVAETVRPWRLANLRIWDERLTTNSAASKL